MVDVAQQLQRRVRAADLVEPGEVRRERAALASRRPPSRGSGSGTSRSRGTPRCRADRHVLEQLVAGVHAPARRAGRGDRGADLERRRAAVLQVGVQDVGRVDEEVRPHQVVGLVGELAEVLLDLPLRGAPREVRVGLVEADRAERRASSRGRVNASARKSTSGSVRRTSREQPLPERHRLGVRVVDAEDPHAVRHPEPDDPQHLAADAGRVVVEVDRVDVLVLLRRVLGVGDGAVGAGGEPLRVARSPTGGPARPAGRGRARPRGRARRRGRRTRRSRRTCRGRGGSRRGRRPWSRSPTGSRGRPGPGSRVLLGPLRLTSPIGWIGGR